MSLVNLRFSSMDGGSWNILMIVSQKNSFRASGHCTKKTVVLPGINHDLGDITTYLVEPSGSSMMAMTSKVTQTWNQKFSGQSVLFGIRGKNILLCLTFHFLPETDDFIYLFASAATQRA